MYDSNIIEPTEVGEFLELCNKENYQIITCAYLSDSSQILFVVRRPRKPFTVKEEKEESEVKD